MKNINNYSNKKVLSLYTNSNPLKSIFKIKKIKYKIKVKIFNLIVPLVERNMIEKLSLQNNYFVLTYV